MGILTRRPPFAAIRALVKTYNVTWLLAELCRNAALKNLARDIRFAFRTFAKNPGFATVAVLALALGIGPNTAIFSVVYATLLTPLPYPQPDQLVMVWSKVKGERNQVSPADFLDWKCQTSSFQEMAV